MSFLQGLRSRAQGRYERTLARRFGRRPVAMRNRRPVVSFTFDDFPRSALLSGGAILKNYGMVGTYYTSLGLMGRSAPTGQMFEASDLRHLVAEGHELGCHTFAHCHAFQTRPRAFEESIQANRRALQELVPNAQFTSLSYPIANPRPETKRRAAIYFPACRGGGQTYNTGELDLNLLSAFFLEQAHDDAKCVRSLIDAACADGGWLIFATHDVSVDPTPYGCTPAFFEEIVDYAATSGAVAAPISKALELIAQGAE